MYFPDGKSAIAWLEDEDGGTLGATATAPTMSSGRSPPITPLASGFPIFHFALKSNAAPTWWDGQWQF